MPFSTWRGLRLLPFIFMLHVSSTYVGVVTFAFVNIDLLFTPSRTYSYYRGQWEGALCPRALPIGHQLPQRAGRQSLVVFHAHRLSAVLSIYLVDHGPMGSGGRLVPSPSASGSNSPPGVYPSTSCLSTPPFGMS
eukprot:scaffold76769_cov30-Tisochrysis_lutea.AAC.3